MEDIVSWSREYFIANESDCVQKLENLSIDERLVLRRNFEEMETHKMVLLNGMISDIASDTELYCKRYQLKLPDGSVRAVASKYVDKVDIADDQDVVEEDSIQNLGERQTLFVSTPASTNQWVIQLYNPAENSAKRKLNENAEANRKIFTVKVESSNFFKYFL